MDRDTFWNSRRARHFGRSNQNFQNPGRSEPRRTLRDSYLNENLYDRIAPPPGAFLPPPQFFCPPFPFPLEALGNMTPPMSERENVRDQSDLSFQFSGLGIESDESLTEKSGESPSDSPKYLRISRLSSLPSWALDENREIRHDLSLQRVVDEGLILMFAMDKSGCHFLQSNYYGENTPHISPFLRERIGKEVLGNRDVFLTICKNIFGNFFLQRVIEFSDAVEQEIIKRYIVSDIISLCLDKSACRVVQTALEKLEPQYADAIVGAIPRKHRLMSICTDQNANHVIQKVVKKMPLIKWEFLVTFLCKADQDNLLQICQDKYGCRVVQTIVEVLSTNSGCHKSDTEEKLQVLRRLMSRILGQCHQLASNEFANYVIQHIIETPGVLSEYRNTIIETCLLRNLLSMSQEKYASHVIERAFCFAPLPHVAEMMEEIFNGYVPHPDTGKDALDILIFHQFGNYVVQRMLQICCTAVLGKRDTIINGIDCHDKFEGWLAKLYSRATKERARLTRFSSGKKILEILENMEKKYKFPVSSFECSPYSSSSSDLAITSLFSPSNTAEWPSRKNSFSSDHQNEFDFNFTFPKF